ncbi:MAG: aldehyde dehydrogenase family protein [Deltaproteobacteria bacterium]|nr:aldehyde dehydrogenase family protein [Deltaproteobacteria bacterium]
MTSPPEETICLNPATGEEIGRSPLNSVGDVHQAVARGQNAQPFWAGTPLEERIAALRAVRDHLAAHADELAAVISQDNGKTRTDALAAEVLPAAMALTYYCKHARRFLTDRRLTPGNILLANKRPKLVRIPFGVVGIISPWNYPFAIPFSEVVMALLAGNAVILKVASETQLVGRALERALAAAGLPSGVFTHLNLPGRVAGEAFLEAGVDKLFFTGSVRVGKQLMAKAAETLTPLSLELGGNDAMIVAADADLKRAANGAVWAGLQNCGQSCGGVERIYVHREVYPRFLELLGERVRALRIGVDTDHNLDLGAMTTTRQMDLVRAHVDDALAQGAEIFSRADPPAGLTGNFLPALVLTKVTHDMRVMREETFGPVLGVMEVGDLEEALELANDSDLGLTASVWSKNTKEAEKLARRIRAGAVTINDHLMSHGLAETPWGGFKESGLGRTHGELGFAEMTEPQVIVHDIMPFVKKDMWWHPHSKAVYQGLGGIVQMLYGKGLGKRLGGMMKMMRIFPRTFF